MFTLEAIPTKLETASTGVVRSHRRRGITTAMKLRAIQWAQANGYESIETDNEENNPMYAINMQLGYQPMPAWLSYQKEL